MSAPSNSDRHAEYNLRKLFIISCLALVAAGVSFAIRMDTAADLESQFFKPLDSANSSNMIGACLGVAFLGFAFTIPFGSALCDALGMGFLLRLSSLCFIGGPGIIIFADKIKGFFPVEKIAAGAGAGAASTPVDDGGIYWTLYIGMLLTGVGWGLVETVINPLCATVYPEDKTHKLNVLHAWWPGGLIIGGLMGVGVHHYLPQATWETKYMLALIPALAFGVMTIGTRFPPTERVASGVSFGNMFSAAISPFFLLWFLSMWLTAASELAPGQWVNLSLTRNVGFQGTLILVYVSALMFVMRHFAGTLAHKLSPVGVLWVSCALASLGLVLLSGANGPVSALVAATIWGTGVCYMWPTMLAAASERFPRTGALGMGLMGFAGTMSIYKFLPKMGSIFDSVKVKVAGGEPVPDAVTAMIQTFTGGLEPSAASKTAFAALENAAKLEKDAGISTVMQQKLNECLSAASTVSFRSVAILPAVLLVSFGAIWLYDKSKGGYKPTSIVEAAEETAAAAPAADL